MMKILHIVGDSKFGGGSVIIAQLAIDQSLSGNNVSVLTTDTEFSEYLSTHSVNVVNLDCIWRSYNLFSDVYGIFKLAKYLRSNRYDVVHTHTTKAGFVGRVAAWLAKTKCIIHTVHGFPFSEISSKIKVAVFSKLEALLYKITTKIVFVSNYHLAWAVNLRIVDSHHKKAVAIRNGVEPVSAALSVELGEAQTRIVFIGRMVKEKGIFDLLAAYQILRETYPDLLLVFIGDGPDLVELRTQVAELENILFTGFVTDVPSLISVNDIFVLPSYREGLSISAIEAQSMGLASILSDVGGNVEVSDEGRASLVFKVSDIQDLVCKLDFLISDENAREQLKINAKQNYTKNYTSQRMLGEYSQLYSKIVSLMD